VNFWQPSSDCGADCLLATPRVGRLRQLGRLVALAGVVASGGVLLPLLPAHRRASALRRVAAAALRALGIRLRVRGTLPARRALLVANHISWLDILVLLAAGRCTLLAKVEIRDWPVIGKVAARTGTVFIDRVRPKLLPGTVAQVRARLAAGAVLAAFPEATTSCGAGIGPFRPALFQAALDAGTPVVPVLLRFTTAGQPGPATAAAFIGAETLLTSLARILAARHLTVTVHAASAIHPDSGATRRDLARLAADAVRAEWPAWTPPATPTTPVTAPAPRLALLHGASPGRRADTIPGAAAQLPPAA
jgi:1-acyl-sn-glycerol-3-phosphate acyltransferase